MLQIQHIYKEYKTGSLVQKALDDVSLNLRDNEFVAILGPSGSGKTTLLNIIGGLDRYDSGDLIINGISTKKYKDRDWDSYRNHTIGFVFQSYNLIPHQTVLANVELALTISGIGKAERKKRAVAALEQVGLGNQLHKKPSQMSGGQMQRVAIARALANKPHVLLLDEPLGALDLKLRKDMQRELKNIQQELGITFIYVTHDQEEALSMSDTVVVMDKGKIQQIGTPEDIYNEPVNAFVADFIGESNIVDAIMLDDYLVTFGGVKFKCLDSGFEKNEFVEAVVRPEDIVITEVGAQASLTGTITSVTFKGVHFEILVDVGGFIWMIQTTQEHHKVGETIGMYIEPDAIHIMKRSEYSGEFGDYSSFSDEMDHISDASYNWEEEENED